MDPLSINASVIARQQLIQAIQRRLQDVHNGPKEYQSLLIELGLTLTILEQYTRLADSRRWDLGQSHLYARIVLPSLDALGQVSEDLLKSIAALSKNGASRRFVWALRARGIAEQVRIFREVRQNLSLLLQLVSLESQQQELYQRAALINESTRSVVGRSIDLTLQKSPEDTSSSLRSQIAEWLSPLDFQDRQNAIWEKRTPETGLWFLSEPKYRNWLGGSGQALWCPGAPGSGKTVLASTIVNHVQSGIKKGEIQGALAFAYCNYGEQEVQTVHNLVGSLLCQLFDQCLTVPEILESFYKQHASRQTEPQLHDLSVLLFGLSETFEKVYIVVDALDECQESNHARSAFLSVLKRLSLHANILITSRFSVDVEREWEKEVVQIERCEITSRSEDVALFLASKIQEMDIVTRIAKDDPELQTAVQQTLLEKSGGMFLMAQLLAHTLEGARSKRHLKRALRYIPDSLDYTYDTLLKRIAAYPNPENDLAIEALVLITYARRPLTSGELQYALAISLDDETFDADQVFDFESLIDLCRPFVFVDHSQKIVRLIHYSAREYLERHLSDLFPDFNLIILKKCMTCLSFKDSFSNGPCSTDLDLEARLAASPFLEYAAKYWAMHVDRSTPSDTQIRIMELLKHESRLAKMMQIIHNSEFPYPSYSQNYPKDAQGLHIGAVFGLTEACRKLLLISQNPDPQSEFYGTPLQAASLNGHLNVVRLLMERGADLNAQSGRYCTALQAAAYTGREAVIDFLLSHKDPQPDLNIMGGAFDTALQAAVSEGHDHIVQRLLDLGAHVNAKRGGGRTALHRASALGSIEVVRILLKNGAQVDMRDGSYGRTPLAVAAWNGHLDCVQLLADSGANINAVDSQRSTPLHLALERNQQKVAQLLIDRNARLDVANDAQKTQAQLALDSIEKIDPENFERDEELSDELEPGAQAQSISVHRRKDEPGALMEKHKYVIRKTFSLVANKQALEHKKQLVRERELLKNLNHQNIVQYLRYEETAKSGKPHRASIYTEYCDGGDLVRYCKSLGYENKLKEFEAWKLFHDLASALAYCHHGLDKNEEGSYFLKHKWTTVLHRDIKPANIVLTGCSSGVRVAKLCDLGLAKTWKGLRAYQTKHVGSEMYQAPEIQDGEAATIKGDVYSLGATLGDLMYDFEDNRFEQLLSRCMSKTNPSRRPCSLTILEETSRHLKRLGYEAGTSGLLNGSATEGHFLAGAIIESLDRIITSYHLTTKGNIQEMVSRVEELIEDGESSEPLRSHENRIWTSALATFILGHHQRAKSLIVEQREDGLLLGKRHGVTILHVACDVGPKEIVQACIEHGMDLSAADTKLWTPLHWAAHAGQVEISKLLLSKGVKTGEQNDRGSTPFHVATDQGHKDIIQLFIEAKLPCDTRDWEDATPLHRAASQNRRDIAQILTTAGASLSATDKEGLTPEQSARTNGHQALAAWLTEQARPPAKNLER